MSSVHAYWAIELRYRHEHPESESWMRLQEKFPSQEAAEDASEGGMEPFELRIVHVTEIITEIGEEVEHDETCCMNGVPAGGGSAPECPGVAVSLIWTTEYLRRKYGRKEE